MHLEKIRSLSINLSLVTALIGCIVMVGWVFHIELLTSVFLGLPSMRVNAALGFIFSGASLWLWHQSQTETSTKRQKEKRLSFGLALVVACIALLTLIQYFFNINLGIDELFIGDFTSHIGYNYSGRMALTAALNFLILSSALIFLNRGIYILAQGFAFVSFLISLLGLVGYIYQVQYFYSLFSGGSIAINAIIAFCLLSLSILFARADFGWMNVITSSYSGGIIARRLLPLAIGLPLLMGGSLLLSHRYHLIPFEVSIISRSIINILIFTIVIWGNARFLNRLDEKQQQTELALRQAYEELENRVAERTAELTNVNNCLEQSYQLLHSVIEGISDSIFLKDRVGQYVLVNSAMTQKFGRSNGEILGLNDYDLFDREIAQKLIETDDRIMELGKTEIIEEEILKNNSWRTYLSTKSPWRDRNDNVIGLIGVVKDISDRKQIELALKQSEQRYANLASIIPVGVYRIDTQGYCNYVNQRWCELAGLSAAQGMGKGWEKAVHPEDCDRIHTAWQEVIHNQSIFCAEYRYQRPDGSISWVYGQAVAELAANGEIIGYISTITDITEHKRIEQDLQAAKQRVVNIWESMSDAFVAVDRNWQITYVNQMTAQINQVSPEELIGKNHWQVWPASIGTICEEKYRQAIAELTPVHFEYFYEPRQRWYEIHAYPSSEGLGIYYRDIDDRKQAEISLQESEERFRRAIIDSPLPIILHASDGTVLQINHAWTEITGYSLEEIPTLADWTEKAYGNRKELVRAEIKRLYDLDCRFYNGEYTISTKSGETRIWDFYSASLGKLPDGRKLMISKAIDITERKQAEADLQQYKDIFQFTEHGIALGKGQVMEIVNPAFARMHGYSVEEMIGKPILSLFPPYLWANTISFMQELNEVGHLTHESYHVRKDGTIFPIFLDVTVVRDRQKNPLYRIVTLLDISDRKKVLAALQESEERLRLALEAANQGMWDLNVQTGEAIVSAEYAQMFGYELEEFQETNAKWKERLHPEERESVYQVYTDYIAGKRDDYRVECRQLTKTGEWKWVLSVGKVVECDRFGQPLRMMGTHTDISDRKQAEENLKESEKQLRSILENMPVMLDAFDAEGNIIVWNQECERVTGYSSEEIIGNPQAWKILYPDATYRQTMRKKWREIGNNYRDWEWDLVSKNGEMKTISWSNIAALFKIPGWTNWGIGIDITERKQAELEVMQLNQNLEQKVKERTVELAAANQELEAFAYSVSHDLRAPLRAIDGFSKVLLQRYTDQLDEQGQHYLDRIRTGTQRMGELIDDLLMLSRVTRAEMKRVPVNLTQIAEEIIKGFSESQPQRSVEWNIASEITALGDSALLRIMLENLLSNAWKFTSNCTQTHIEFGVTTLSENRQAYFVKDNGVGFDMTYANKLFIAFQRLHSINEFPGTGVGLAIVQRIIHRHGGNVWAEGIINQGATFYFTLE